MVDPIGVLRIEQPLERRRIFIGEVLPHVVPEKTGEGRPDVGPRVIRHRGRDVPQEALRVFDDRLSASLSQIQKAREAMERTIKQASPPGFQPLRLS